MSASPAVLERAEPAAGLGDYAKAILNKTIRYLEAPHRTSNLTAPGMTAAIPLRAAIGPVVAVLAARLNLAALSAIVQRHAGLRQTEDAFLVDSGQFPITQPRFMSETAISHRKLDTD